MNKHEDPVTKLDCDICGLRLPDDSGLKLHKETQHPVHGKEDHKCPICPKISPTLRALKRHISTMHDRGCEYKCSLCEKAFRRPESLKVFHSILILSIVYLLACFCFFFFVFGRNIWHPIREQRYISVLGVRKLSP